MVIVFLLCADRQNQEWFCIERNQFFLYIWFNILLYINDYIQYIVHMFDLRTKRWLDGVTQPGDPLGWALEADK